MIPFLRTLVRFDERRAVRYAEDGPPRKRCVRNCRRPRWRIDCRHLKPHRGDRRPKPSLAVGVPHRRSVHIVADVRKHHPRHSERGDGDSQRRHQTSEPGPSLPHAPTVPRVALPRTPKCPANRRAFQGVVVGQRATCAGGHPCGGGAGRREGGATNAEGRPGHGPCPRRGRFAHGYA